MQQPLDCSAVEEFLALDPTAVVKHTLTAAHTYEQQFISDEKNAGGLFERAELVALLDSETPGQIKGRDACYLPSRFKKGTVYESIMRFHAMQSYLRRTLEKYGQPPTAQQVLKAMDRDIAPSYAAILRQTTLTAIQRFVWIQNCDPNNVVVAADMPNEKRAPAKIMTIASSHASRWIRPSQLKPSQLGLEKPPLPANVP